MDEQQQFGNGYNPWVGGGYPLPTVSWGDKPGEAIKPVAETATAIKSTADGDPGNPGGEPQGDDASPSSVLPPPAPPEEPGQDPEFEENDEASSRARYGIRPVIAAAVAAAAALIGLPMLVQHLASSTVPPAAATTPVHLPTPRTAQSADAAPAASFSPTGGIPTGFAAVAGPGCSNSGAGFQQNGYYTDGANGWVATASGGFSGDGCSGAYVSLPMSGDPTHDDENSAVWSFNAASATPAPSACDIAVYVPRNQNVQIVGGQPAYYTVEGTGGSDLRVLGVFTVDQVKAQGQWVDAGTFPLNGGQISVRLHSRGDDTTNHAHLAAAAMRATCPLG